MTCPFSGLKAPAEIPQAGIAKIPAENPKKCSCGGIDTPGVGTTHAADCPLAAPPSLRRLLNNEPPALLLLQERENADDDADDVELLAGIERNMKVLNDRRQRRDDLLSTLIFAARALAEHNFALRHDGVGVGDANPVLICLDCKAVEHRGRVSHTNTCRTGRVLGIIAELMATADFNLKEKENALAEETSCAGDGIRPRGLSERVCLKCGVRGGVWFAQQRPEEEVQLSSLEMNQCASAGIEGKGHTLYTHRCESRACAVASRVVDEMAEGGVR